MSTAITKFPRFVGEVSADMVRTPQEQTWKALLNQWAQIVLLILTIITSVVVVEHRLTTLEDTTKQQAQASEKAAALSSLAVDSVIQWIQMQAITPPKELKKKGDDFIKQIQERQKKISQAKPEDTANGATMPR